VTRSTKNKAVPNVVFLEALHRNFVPSVKRKQVPKNIQSDFQSSADILI
jgi:hypothetical protein